MLEIPPLVQMLLYVIFGLVSLIFAVIVLDLRTRHREVAKELHDHMIKDAETYISKSEMQEIRREFLEKLNGMDRKLDQLHKWGSDHERV